MSASPVTTADRDTDVLDADPDDEEQHDASAWQSVALGDEPAMSQRQDFLRQHVYRLFRSSREGSSGAHARASPPCIAQHTQQPGDDDSRQPHDSLQLQSNSLFDNYGSLFEDQDALGGMVRASSVDCLPGVSSEAPWLMSGV